MSRALTSDPGRLGCEYLAAQPGYETWVALCYEDAVGSTPTRRLLVARGLDAGAHLVLDERVKIVGRARDAQLVLSDRSVSRHHFHIRATPGGAYVRLCRGAARLLVDGREIDAAEVKLGTSIIAGNTVLLVAEPEGSEPVASPESVMHEGATTTIGSLLTGVAADVRGLAGVFSLNEALSEARDASGIEGALKSWAKVYAACETVDLAAAGSEQPAAPEKTEKKRVVEVATTHGGTRILVPALGTPTGWLAFETQRPPDRMSDSLRRLLVVAASLCGSRFAQLSLLVAAKEEGESFRRQAVGSARTFSGSSAEAQRLARVVPKLAASDVNVLLLGETGAGKSFVARLIHESGPRKDEPFRVINCASIPESLIESELFGHERGAFTGAATAQQGAFEAVGRGTVLLDEIGELPLGGQAKLLRALEDKRFERLGSNRSLTFQARIIAATNRNLEEMVKSGTFRIDLFFRISAVRAHVPSLRERGDDLPFLAKQILADLAPSAGRRIDGFSAAALTAIRWYAWPGNVRELRNAIEHALVLGDGPWIEPSDLAIPADAGTRDVAGADPLTVRLPANLEWLERRAIEAALQETGGNQTKAAALLGINRNTLALKRRASTE